MVENGTLNFFFNCLSTARQLKDIPSGHASRSVSSIPNASYTNLYLAKGKYKKSDMVKSMKKGLIVTELMGSSINYSNGDYSRGASGFWVENGEIQYPISELTIAGNLLDMLKSIIPANDAREYVSRVVPSLLIDGMTIAGS